MLFSHAIELAVLSEFGKDIFTMNGELYIQD